MRVGCGAVGRRREVVVRDIDASDRRARVRWRKRIVSTGRTLGKLELRELLVEQLQQFGERLWADGLADHGGRCTGQHLALQPLGEDLRGHAAVRCSCYACRSPAMRVALTREAFAGVG